MVIIQDETIKNPITLIGKEAGVCWNGKNTPDANFERGMDCIKNNHGRTLEFPQVYLEIDGYSARMIRELYVHIGGMPSRLQSSTRYINYSDFEYIIPPKVGQQIATTEAYNNTISQIKKGIAELLELGVPREDAAMLLPLCMTSKVVMRTNLRQLIDMSKQRMCTRAYHEFRQFMNDLLNALSGYSREWKIIVEDLDLFHAKCEDYGYCPESKGCGKHPKKEETNV